MQFTPENIVIGVLILAIVYKLWMYEHYDETGTEFVPVGAPRYGLRGDLLHRRDISRNYLRPDRHIRLSRSNDVMYESDVPPYMEKIPNCYKAPCPKSDAFDCTDTCWKC